MKKYRKKPVVIEAIQWDGQNIQEVNDFVGYDNANLSIVQWVPFDNSLVIPTLEGNMKASVSDYIIKGIQGEFYPCKPDIFEQTYDELK